MRWTHGQMPHTFKWCSTENALTVQRARDAAEERAAWVRFAAALMSTCDQDGVWTGDHPSTVSERADAMLTEYRKRFGASPEET
jgi:hypothetical protein